MDMTRPPEPTEYSPYYSRYVELVPIKDIRQTLELQRAESLSLLEGISEEQSLHRYEPGKWSIRDVISHLTDTERVFAFRALWFARGFGDALPSFDQDSAVEQARADERSWRSHVDDFGAVRSASMSLFGGLPEEAWTRKGVASGVEVSVRALAWIVAGHVAHHNAIIREKYLGTR